MKVSIEQILQTSEKSLRTFVESETVVNLYHGYDRTEEDGRKEGKRVGVVYDVQSLIVGLADLLQKYPDIEVVQHDNYLSITGEPKTSSRNVDTVNKFEFYYHAEYAYIRITEDGEFHAYNHQLEFLENVCRYIIYRILLWIQDDKELKKCYLELLEFIQPYYNMLLSQKNEFQTVMLTNVLQILKEMPKEKVYSMPVTLNIPYLAVRLKEELDSYNLENTEQQYHCHGLHAFFRLNEMRVMIGLDSSTMNGIVFLFRSSEAPYIRLLSARQIDSMIRQIALKLNELENIYCRLFAEKMMDELYSLLSWTESTEVVK